MRSIFKAVTIMSYLLIAVFCQQAVLYSHNIQSDKKKTPVPAKQKQADHWFQKGEALLTQKNYEKAFQTYKSALNLNPKHMGALFRSGMLMMKHFRNEKQALRYFNYGIKVDPQYPAFHYNAGQIFQNLKQYRAALARFMDAAILQPENWKVRAKLIQLYDVLADFKNRDAQHQKLYSLYKRGKVKTTYFCRDQFFVDKNIKVISYESFELKGDFALKYTFYLVDSKSNKLKFRFILGSYHALNLIWRKQGKLKKDQRLYHIDGYTIDGRSHWTFGFYLQEPSYDKVKEIIIAILQRKIKPISGSTPTSRTAKPKKQK